MTGDADNVIHKSCERYGGQDYARYVREQMSEQEAVEFEAHAHSCSVCLREILHARASYLSEKEDAENELLLSRTLTLMDRLDQSIFSIVIRAARGMVELIRSTGEQMVMTPALTGVRSSAGTADSEPLVPLRIVKDFEESRLSVEVTISPLEPDMLDVTVSLLDRQHEDFIPGVAVSCRGEGEIHDEITDDEGRACFRVSAAGFYEIVMNKDGIQLGTMTLNAV